MNNEQNKYKSIGAILLVIVLVILAGYFVMKSMNSSNNGQEEMNATTTEDGSPMNNNSGSNGTTGSNDSPENYSSYANAEYNFKMSFPKMAKVENAFTSFYNLGNNWRAEPNVGNQGKGVVAFSIFKVDQGSVATGKDYPLFFTAEVRVGVSNNVKDCYSPDAGYDGQVIKDVVINGVTFKKFSFGDAAMMKYIQGESYRTVHNNMCYVIEQIKAGSSYKDDTMKPGISEETLNNYYSYGESIVKSFQFTK